MKQDETLPAIDNEDLRALNTKKIVDSVEKVGKHFDELKKQNRVTFVVGLITAICMVLFLGSIIYSAFSVGGGFISNIVDIDMLVQRYHCINNNESLMFRNPQSLHYFKLSYPNATCRAYTIK